MEREREKKMQCEYIKIMRFTVFIWKHVRMSHLSHNEIDISAFDEKCRKLSICAVALKANGIPNVTGVRDCVVRRVEKLIYLRQP